MIKEIVLGTAIASSFGSWGDVVFEKDSSSTLKSVDTTFSVNFDAEYNVPAGFSFDLSTGHIESNFLERWSSEKNTKRESFMHGLEAGFSGYGEVGEIEDFKIRGNEFLCDIKETFEENVAVNLNNIYDSGLEELAREGRRLGKYSRIEKKNGECKYIFDLDADASLKVDSVISSNFVYSDGSKLKMKYGVYGSGEARSTASFNLGANWNDKELGKNAAVEYRYDTFLEIDKGDFIEIVREKDDWIFGGGLIRENTTREFSLKENNSTFSINHSSLNAEVFSGKSEIEEESEEQKRVSYIVAGFNGDKLWTVSNVGTKESRETGVRNTLLRDNGLVYGSNGLEKISSNLNIEHDIYKRSNGFVYGVAGGVRAFDADGFEVDVYGYSKKLFDEKSGVGVSLRSDLLNINFDGDSYFGAVKLSGKGGDFENDFRKRTMKKGNFVEGYGYENLWKNKNGVYGFVEKRKGEKRMGAAVCLDSLCLIGGVAEKRGMSGYFVEADMERFRIKGSYLNNERNEKGSLGMEFNVTKYLSIRGSADLSSGNASGVVMFKFSF